MKKINACPLFFFEKKEKKKKREQTIFWVCHILVSRQFKNVIKKLFFYFGEENSKFSYLLKQILVPKITL